jgi:hypothetical protein
MLPRKLRCPRGLGFDRLARSTRHYLTVLDELNRFNIEFLIISFRDGDLSAALAWDNGMVGANGRLHS